MGHMYPCCGDMSTSCIETTVHVFMAFLETYNHLSVCLSLQPFQFGITRTQRKSADIPTRVSTHPAVQSMWIYMYIFCILYLQSLLCVPKFNREDMHFL